VNMLVSSSFNLLLLNFFLIGEVLTKRQADAREKEFGCQYMYDLEDMLECLTEDRVEVRKLPHAIDSRVIGNASRFVNHSCDPNLVVKTHPTFVQNTFQGYGLCRVVFEALRSINKGDIKICTFNYNHIFDDVLGDELTVDYYPGMTKEDLTEAKNRAKCHCNAGKGICRGWILL